MKTVVITGASSGIGAIAAREIALHGNRVAVVGRNPERTRAVAEKVGGTAFIADFDKLSEVRDLAARLGDSFESIDVLANNAGGLVGKKDVSADGFERTIQHNHLAPFLLTNLLLPKLTPGTGRVVSTASIANRWGNLRLDDLQWRKRPWLGGWPAYGTSKTATILFIRELAKRAPVEAFSFHPGFVSTGFGTDSIGMRISLALKPGGFGIPAEQGAVPLIRLITEERVDAPNGTYFDQLEANGATSQQALDDDLAAQLWERSAELVRL